MRAALYRENGPAANVLQVEEVESRRPGPGEVLVELHASGVNPADAKRRGGWARIVLDTPFLIPQDDGAGYVRAVGEGVDPSLVDSRVWVFDARVGTQYGTAAEWVTLPARRVEPLPDNVSFAEGAALGAPARTAHRCLFSDGSIDGAHVLVAGAAGSVGHSAVQQARAAGAALVIGTVGRAEHVKVAEEAGCHLVLDYRSTDIVDQVMQVTDGHGIDRIVEVDFAANMDVDCRVAALNSTIAVYGTDTNHKPEVPLWRLMNNSVNVRNILLYNLPYDQHQLAAADINRWAGEGSLVPRIGLRFSLEEIVQAHEAVEKRTSNGNVIVDIVDPTGRA